MDEKSSHEHTPKTKKNRPLRVIKNLLVIAILVTLSWFGVMYARQSAELNQIKQNQAKTADQETAELTNSISKHMVLPKEKPTIATVEDPKRLTGQSFFKNAHKGDKVLMYPESKKAILYRPSENKIIEVALLNIQGATTKTGN